MKKSPETGGEGSRLAFLSRDRVVAVETNPDWGSLGRRLVPDHETFIDDLLAGPLAYSRLPPTDRFHPAAPEWRGQLERAVRLEIDAHHQMRALRGRHDTTAADGLQGT